MKSRIAIVALNIHIHDKGYSTYISLPAIQKIAYIKKRILEICKQLEQNASAKWFIVWREHGITSETGLSLPAHFKDKLKSMLLEIIQMYPQLTIIAGTLLTHQTFNTANDQTAAKNKLSEIKSQSKKNCQWIEKKENSNNKKSAVANNMKILTEAEILSDGEIIFHTYQNECFIASDNNVVAQAKIAGKDETAYERIEGIKIFQPGNDRPSGCLYETSSPPNTNNPITYAVEICQEHALATLKELHPHKKPLIQFILSNPTLLNLDHLHAEYAVQIDSLFMPRLLYVGDPENINQHFFSVELYQNNLLDEHNNQLEGPLNSIYPFEKQVIDLFRQYSKSVSGEEPYPHVNIHKNFMDHIKKSYFAYETGSRTYLENSYSLLSQLLAKWKVKLFESFVLPKKEETLYRELNELIAFQQKYYPTCKDYLIEATSKAANTYRSMITESILEAAKKTAPKKSIISFKVPKSVVVPQSVTSAMTPATADKYSFENLVIDLFSQHLKQLNKNSFANNINFEFLCYSSRAFTAYQTRRDGSLLASSDIFLIGLIKKWKDYVEQNKSQFLPEEKSLCRELIVLIRLHRKDHPNYYKDDPITTSLSTCSTTTTTQPEAEERTFPREKPLNDSYCVPESRLFVSANTSNVPQSIYISPSTAPVIFHPTITPNISPNTPVSFPTANSISSTLPPGVDLFQTPTLVSLPPPAKQMVYMANLGKHIPVSVPAPVPMFNPIVFSSGEFCIDTGTQQLYYMNPAAFPIVSSYQPVSIPANHKRKQSEIIDLTGDDEKESKKRNTGIPTTTAYGSASPTFYHQAMPPHPQQPLNYYPLPFNKPF